VAALLFRRRALIVVASALVIALSWSVGSSVVPLLSSGGEQFAELQRRRPGAESWRPDGHGGHHQR
jgi:hypothetical protein